MLYYTTYHFLTKKLYNKLSMFFVCFVILLLQFVFKCLIVSIALTKYLNRNQ